MPDKTNKKIVLSIIVAMAKDGLIGRDKGLPWNLPEDLQLFRRHTMGKPMLMGRKTFESLPGVLPGRKHYVISRNPAYKLLNARAAQSDEVILVSSFEEALLLVEGGTDRDGEALEEKAGEPVELFVVGGGKVYSQMLPLADRLYISKVHGSYEGDTYFPEIDYDDWILMRQENYTDFDFFLYERKREIDSENPSSPLA